MHAGRAFKVGGSLPNSPGWDFATWGDISIDRRTTGARREWLGGSIRTILKAAASFVDRLP
jgi:hypothetical protein